MENYGQDSDLVEVLCYHYVNPFVYKKWMIPAPYLQLLHIAHRIIFHILSLMCVAIPSLVLTRL